MLKMVRCSLKYCLSVLLFFAEFRSFCRLHCANIALTVIDVVIVVSRVVYLGMM